MQEHTFSERVRQVLTLARQEAIARKHDYVAPEHILIALVTEGNGVACAVLQNLDIKLDEVVRRIDEVKGRGKSDLHADDAEAPFTSRAKRSLELAMSNARDFHHNYVGTEHLLLGILNEEKNVAAQTLAVMGATLSRVRKETARLLATEVPAATRQNVHTDITSVSIEIHNSDGTVVKEEFRSVFTAIGFLQKQIG